jgi:hypothetical protein
MADMYKKRYLTPYVIRELQIKATDISIYLLA